MSEPSYMAIRFETLQQAQDDLGMAYAAVQQSIDTLEGELQKEPGPVERFGQGRLRADQDAVGSRGRAHGLCA